MGTTRSAGGSTRRGRSRPSWSGRSPAGTARRRVAGGVPMSYPPRKAPGFYPGRLPQPRQRARLRQRPGDSWPSWRRRSDAVSPVVHGGPRRRERGPGAGRVDRLPGPSPQGRAVPHGSVPVGPVHVRPDGHRPRPARALARLGPVAPRGQGAGSVEGSRRVRRLLEAAGSRASARSRPRLPPDTALILMSDHGFGPIEWYVNFNVWLLEQGVHRACKIRSM